MSFMDSVKTCLSKVVTFDGRARRSEYWWFYLFILIVNSVVNGIIQATGVTMTVILVVSVIISLCSLSVSIRRLHDIGKSGWWILINLIPLIGTIIFIIFAVKDSEPGENKYGPNPKGM